MRCPHNNVQQFTECCLDCGRNVYESDEEYLHYLRSLKKDDEIEKLERELGINHPGNQEQQGGPPDCGMW